MYALQQSGSCANYKPCTPCLPNHCTSWHITGIALTILGVSLIAWSAWSQVQMAQIFSGDTISILTGGSQVGILLPRILGICALIGAAYIFMNDTGVSHRFPMEAKCVKHNYRVGDQVKSGEVISILEAMKMNMEIKATCSGTITAINYQPGEIISKEGKPLFIIQPD